jgi:hypothetical protein
MSHCHGLACPSATDLVEAHFIAQAFPRQIRKRSGRANTTVSERRFTRSLQHGLFDDDILCGSCDAFLGRKYDEPAFKLLSTLRVIDLARPTFEIPNVDCDVLCAYVLSVLWRCSISKKFELSNIDLGGYTNPVRAALWGALRLSDLRAYRLLLQRYYPHPGVDELYSLPIRTGFEVEGTAWPCGYILSLVGFRFLAIIDPRPLPAQYDRFILNGSTILRGSFSDFAQTFEAEQARSVLAFHGKAPQRGMPY